MLISYFTSASGAQPVRKYIEALNRAARAKVDAAVLHISKHGIDGEVNARQIKGKLWELKLDAQRIFYVVVSGPQIVLLHAYQKQSQKAPRVRSRQQNGGSRNSPASALEGARSTNDQTDQRPKPNEPTTSDEGQVKKNKQAGRRAIVAGDAVADAQERMVADPEYAAQVRGELERLEVARRVRQLREGLNVTQKELADRLGTGQPSIARLESGQVVPRLDFLSRVARALGARVDVRFVANAAPRRRAAAGHTREERKRIAEEAGVRE